MGRGRSRRDSTQRLGIYFTDRAVVVAGVDLSRGAPVLTWATTAPLSHGAVIAGIIRDVRATTQALIDARIPDRPAVVAVPDDRRPGPDDEDNVVAYAGGAAGVIESTARRRTLMRIQHVLERSKITAEGWIPAPFADAAHGATAIEDPEGLGAAGVDLSLAIGAALWPDPEPWPPVTSKPTQQRGWRVTRVG